MKLFYEHSGITIYHGDCRDLLPSLPPVDLLLTDPPYDEKTHEGAILEGEGISFDPLNMSEILPMLFRASNKWSVAFCSLEMLGKYKEIAGDRWVRAGIWDRVVNMPQLSGDRPAQGAEGLAIMHPPGIKKWNGGGDAAIWRFQVERGHKQHPTQKPVRLMTRLCYLFSNDGETVLDPFMGSGTTLVAAKSLGRNAIGIEVEERYCEIAVKRLSQEILPLASSMSYNRPKEIEKSQQKLSLSEDS